MVFEIFKLRCNVFVAGTFVTIFRAPEKTKNMWHKFSQNERLEQFMPLFRDVLDLFVSPLPDEDKNTFIHLDDDLDEDEDFEYLVDTTYDSKEEQASRFVLKKCEDLLSEEDFYIDNSDKKVLYKACHSYHMRTANLTTPEDALYDIIIRRCALEVLSVLKVKEENSMQNEEQEQEQEQDEEEEEQEDEVPIERTAPPLATVYDESGRGRKPCKGGCGKFIPSGSKNITCVTSGEVVVKSESKEASHVFSAFPGSEKTDIGKQILGMKKHEPSSIVTSKVGKRTGQTLATPDYTVMEDGYVKKRVIVMKVGNLVDSRKKAYAITYTIDGKSDVRSVLAKDLDTYASDAEFFSMYGHVNKWLGRMKGVDIVLIENILDVPIVNGYYVDISNFYPKKKNEIGCMEITVENDKDLLKIGVGGWKKEDEDIRIVLSVAVYNFGDKGGKRILGLIVFHPLLIHMSFQDFKEMKMKPCHTQFMISLVDEDKLDSDLVESFGYTKMENGWRCKGYLKETLTKILADED
jgi:hypothetical protein